MTNKEELYESHMKGFSHSFDVLMFKFDEKIRLAKGEFAKGLMYKLRDILKDCEIKTEQLNQKEKLINAIKCENESLQCKIRLLTKIIAEGKTGFEINEEEFKDEKRL